MFTAFGLGLLAWGLTASISYFDFGPVHFVLLYSMAGICMLLAFSCLQRGNLEHRGQLAILGLSVLAFASLLPSHPTYDDDLYRYIWDGRVTWERGHPYGIAPSDYRLIPLRDDEFSKIAFRDTPTVYPPVAQLAFALAAKTGNLAPYTLKFILLLAHVLVLAGLWITFKSRKEDFVWLVLYAWNPLIWKEFGNGGHIDLLGVAFLFLGLTLPLSRTSRILLMLLAAGIKPLAWMALGLVMPLSWFLTASFSLAFAISHVPEWVSGVSQFAQHWLFYPFLFEPLQFVVLGAGGSSNLARILAWAPLLATFAFLPRISQEKPRQWLALFVAWIAFSPTINPWYLAWAVPFAVWGKRHAIGIASIFLLPSYLFYENGADPSISRWGSFLLLSGKIAWEEFHCNFKK